MVEQNASRLLKLLTKDLFLFKGVMRFLALERIYWPIKKSENPS